MLEVAQSTPRRIQRFEVIDHLRSGGMGNVFRARDPQLERDVAIKLLATPRPPAELGFSDELEHADEALSRAQKLALDLHATNLAIRVIAQRRHGEARDAAARARELLTGTQARADIYAVVDVTIARAEAGLGQEAQALDRVRRARTVLESYPGQLIARREADALIASAARRR